MHSPPAFRAGSLELRRGLAALALPDINQQVVKAEYAVRGAIILRAAEIKEEMAKNASAFPFDKLVECNIGNPQALKQQPLTFNRQVLSLLTFPALLEMPALLESFPPDAVARAKEYLAAIPQGIGAYSDSQGFPIVCQQVADFISARDGHPASREDIFLTDGASKGVQLMIKLILRNEQDGVLVPIPQYPLYSATLALENANFVGYYLSEESAWALPVEELERSLDSAKSKGINMRALVVINPGNPTGNSLPVENVRDIINFCSRNDLVLMADEVYQENVYDSARPFNSFKKVLREMSPEPPLQLVSFHSTSKGFLGECGLRGGYMEVIGFDPQVKAQILKMASIGLCSNTVGQLVTGLMVQPPKPGDASYESYMAEKQGILGSLKRRAVKLVDALNKLEGVTCQSAQGAMYAFPCISFPPKALAAAEAAGKPPDAFYAMALLEKTGIVVVPGSGFGQRDGTWHFRTTFLPPEHDMEGVMGRLADFHKEFMAKYK
uniref:Aminotransferase class I/classII large domain-containing protein n=1 Tax=Chrysotila carterae TaxID=13221 RepID=A0A7S4BVE2_CHRCT